MRSLYGLPPWPAKVIARLQEKGLEDVEVRRSKHFVIKGRLNGKPFRWVIGATPSDWRAERNAITQLRRQLEMCNFKTEERIFARYAVATLGSDDAGWNDLLDDIG
ncbi:MAG TPA: hypothetical protein VFZ01_13240 [Geminicoccaceae bacterium]